MNKTVKAFPMNDLGNAQAALENASKELTSAQSAFEKAQMRLTCAEEDYAAAQATLTNAVTALRSRVKVTPMSLKNI